MVFEEGKSIGVMGSYNRLGLMETAANRHLLTDVLRGEWGFKGSVLSDMTHSGNGSIDFKCYENVTTRTFAGCNAQLDQGGFGGQTEATWDSSAWGGKGAPTITYKGEEVICWSWWNAVREAVRQHLYMFSQCTKMAQGVTKVLGSNTYDVDRGATINQAVEGLAVGDQYNGKDITEIEYKINKGETLPAGVTFENGTFGGKFAYAGYYRFGVIAKIKLADDSTVNVAYRVAFNVIPDYTDTGLDGIGEGGGKKGGSVNVGLIAGIGGGAVAAAGIAAVVVVLLKKKKVA